MIDTLIAGLLRGNVYALGAVGISLVFGVMNVVNFAQFSFFGLGAMLTWFFVVKLQLSFWVALPLVLVICAALGLLINVSVVRPLAKYLPLAAMLSTYAVAQILDNLSQLAFSAQFRVFPAVLPTSNLQVGNMRFGTSDVVMLGITAVVMITMSVFLKYGKTGRAIRATAQDQEAALQMGIPVGTVQNLSFLIASALGGLAGIFFSLYIGVVNPISGLNIGMTSFVAATLEGSARSPAPSSVDSCSESSRRSASVCSGTRHARSSSSSSCSVVLVVRPGGLLGKVPLISSEPLTGTFLGKGRPLRIPRWVWIAAIVVGGIVIPLVADNYVSTTGTQVLIYAVIGAGFTVTAGQAGVLGARPGGAHRNRRLHLGDAERVPARPVLGCIADRRAIRGDHRLDPRLADLGVKGHYISIATLGLGIAIVAAIQLLVPQAIYDIPVPSIGGIPLNTPVAYYVIDFVPC